MKQVRGWKRRRFGARVEEYGLGCARGREWRLWYEEMSLEEERGLKI